VRDKLVFFLFFTIAGITVSPIIGGLAAVVGHAIGMANGQLLVLFGSTTAGVFAAVMALAALAARLFFK